METKFSIEPREPRIELDEPPPYDRADERPGSYRPGSIYDDGALDDQADEPERILHRFPIFIRHLLARQIAAGAYLPDLTIDELDQWTDDELATKAFCYLPLTNNPTPSDRRKNSYVRILGTALRHFQNDPAAVRASVELVSMIANPRPRLTSEFTDELDG